MTQLKFMVINMIIQKLFIQKVTKKLLLYAKNTMNTYKLLVNIYKEVANYADLLNNQKQGQNLKINL